MADLQLDSKGVIVTCPKCGQRNRLAYEKLDAETRCGKCQTPLAPPDAPIEVPDVAAFDAATSRSTLPVVIDFWAPWCGPCHMVAPELEKVAKNAAGKYLIVKVNTDAVPDLGERFRIRRFRLWPYFKGGERSAGPRGRGRRPTSRRLYNPPWLVDNLGHG